ncbi:MAG: EamA family transporter [Rhodobacteraceae bacterium]|nr:EamA family transporter [Paracoccaceae bacterium]
MKLSTDNTMLAIILSLLAIVLFDLMGLIIKHLSDDYSAFELSAWRNLFGLIPSFIALWSSRSWHQAGRQWKIRQWPLALLRGVYVTFAQVLFYFSLGQMAFATASTITYANAFFMTALAVPMLGERVGLIRWSAVMLGFAGVMMVMGPGKESFSLYALAPLGAAFLYALAGVSARQLDPELSTPLVNLYSAVTAMIGAFLLTLVTSGFSPLASLSDLGWIIAMGGFGGTAVLLLVTAFRMTEQSNLAPFSYFGIPIAFVMGWGFFGEKPFGDLFPGAILIVASGLMVIWRERRLTRSSLD